MLALAIVVLLIVVLLVIGSFAGSSEELVIEFLNVTVTTSVGGVFVTGVVCGLAALASLLALRRSWRQNQARAEEVRELRRLAGVPDPDDLDGTETTTAGPTTGSATAESGKTPHATAAAESSKASGTGGEASTTDETGTTDERARTDVAASPSSANDTAPLPDSEDPPRT